MNTELVIFGAGGHASVVVDTAKLSMPYARLKVVDEFPDGKFFLNEYKVGKFVNWDDFDGDYHIAIGDNQVRSKLSNSLLSSGKKLVSIFHPMASVSVYSEINEGAFVGANAIVATKASIARGVIINHGANIDHHCTILEYSHIAPNATMCGNVSVGRCTLIGADATILPSITIGDNVVIGAGTTVTKNVPTGSVIYNKQRH